MMWDTFSVFDRNGFLDKGYGTGYLFQEEVCRVISVYKGVKDSGSVGLLNCSGGHQM